MRYEAKTTQKIRNQIRLEFQQTTLFGCFCEKSSTSDKIKLFWKENLGIIDCSENTEKIYFDSEDSLNLFLLKYT